MCQRRDGRVADGKALELKARGKIECIEPGAVVCVYDAIDQLDLSGVDADRLNEAPRGDIMERIIAMALAVVTKFNRRTSRTLRIVVLFAGIRSLPL
jgi:hypothetical protein